MCLRKLPISFKNVQFFFVLSKISFNVLICVFAKQGEILIPCSFMKVGCKFSVRVFLVL